MLPGVFYRLNESIARIASGNDITALEWRCMAYDHAFDLVALGFMLAIFAGAIIFIHKGIVTENSVYLVRIVFRPAWLLGIVTVFVAGLYRVYNDVSHSAACATSTQTYQVFSAVLLIAAVWLVGTGLFALLHHRQLRGGKPPHA